MLLGLRGTPVLYQGDEIGHRDVALEPPDLRDPLGMKYWPAYAGRDAMRTPMPWRDGPGAGFTEPGVTPWLPIGNTSRNVERQRTDPKSMLCLARDLIALRKQTPDLHTGTYAALPAPDGVVGVEARRATRGGRQSLGRSAHPGRPCGSGAHRHRPRSGP